MNKVYTICYNDLDIWETKEQAIKFYKDCCDYCDPMSSEYQRYASIIVDLQFSNIGKDNIDDYIYTIRKNGIKTKLDKPRYYLDIIKELEESYGK